MKYGICIIAALPVRESPSDKTEMVSQLLFGEIFEVLDEKDSWFYINNWNDSYKGWIDNKETASLSKNSFDMLQRPENYTIIKEIFILTTMLTIMPGSSLPFYYSDSPIINIEKTKFLIKGKPVQTSKIVNADNVCETAMQFLNAPYLWGGRSLFGIDCSGFTQVVFKIHCIRLPRNANEQALAGNPVDDINLAKAADLAFFRNDEGKVIHTGIILENKRIIHASGRVRIDRIDEKGIYNEELKTHSHHLHCIKRILE